MTTTEPSSETPTGHRRIDGWLHPVTAAGLALGALVARVAYAVLADPQLFGVSDAGGYRLLGRHLSEGRGYIRPYDLALAGVRRPTAEFPPGFPTLLGVLDGLGLDTITEQRVGLAVLGAVTVVLITVLAGRLVSPRLAIGVGVVAAVHPALIQPETALLGESLFLTVTVLLGLAVLDLRDRPDIRRGLAVGALGGIALLVRSEGIVIAALLTLPVVVPRPSIAAIRWGAGSAALAGVVLVAGPWTVRNLATFEEPVFASNNLGSALAGANCPATYSGPLAGFWLISDECFDGFEQEELAAADESVVAARHRDEGLEYVRAHRSELPRVLVIRALRTFQLYEPEQQARLATFEGRKLLTERIGGWIAWATYLVAAGGVIALLRWRAWFTAWFLLVPVGAVVAVSAMTYGNPRFRISAEVPLLLLAATAISALVGTRGRAVPTT